MKCKQKEDENSYDDLMDLLKYLNLINFKHKALQLARAIQAFVRF